MNAKMIPYAYRSIERNEEDIIYACDAIQLDVDKKFFCPNKLCDAELHICSLNGTRKPYFRATKKEHRHVEGCLYKDDHTRSPGGYNENTFSFEDAIDAMMVDSNNTKTVRKVSVNHEEVPFNKPIYTITQVYSMCKSYSVNHVYAGKKICEMLLDDRSINYYCKGCWGKHIVEGRFKQRLYNDIDKIIYITAPINSGQYTFELYFPDESLYKSARNQFYNNRKHCIIVAADWHKTGKLNYFRGIITTAKQYKIL